MTLITDYYHSTARKRNWGTDCSNCSKKFAVGQKLMRASLGKNSNGCNSYNELCMSCYNKGLKTGIENAKEQLKIYIEQEQDRIKELENKVSNWEKLGLN